MRIAERGSVSPTAAWARFVDPLQWPTWAPQIRRVDWPGGHLETGMTGVVHPLLGPTVHFTVTEVDRPARQWSWVVGRGPVRLTMHHGVQPATTGSEVWIDLPLLAALPYLPIARLALAGLVRPAPGP